VSLTEPELKVLMLRSRAGDAAAYRQLLAGLSYRLGVYFGRRLRSDPTLAEDLVQDTLLRVHAKRATFQVDQSVTAWTYAIARYRLIDHLRRTGRGRFIALDDSDELAAEDESTAIEARLDVARGLAGLPERTRDLVVRVKLRGEPIADVARRAGSSEIAVRVAVHRGFMKLAARLRAEGDRK